MMKLKSRKEIIVSILVSIFPFLLCKEDKEESRNGGNGTVNIEMVIYYVIESCRIKT